MASRSVALPPRRQPSGPGVQEWVLPIDANPADFEATGWSLEGAIEAGLRADPGNALFAENLKRLRQPRTPAPPR